MPSTWLKLVKMSSNDASTSTEMMEPHIQGIRLCLPVFTCLSSTHYEVFSLEAKTFLFILKPLLACVAVGHFESKKRIK